MLGLRSKGYPPLWACGCACVRLLLQLLIASVINSNRLHNTEMGQGHRLAGTLLIKDATTIAAMVFPIGK